MNPNRTACAIVTQYHTLVKSQVQDTPDSTQTAREKTQRNRIVCRRNCTKIVYRRAAGKQITRIIINIKYITHSQLCSKTSVTVVGRLRGSTTPHFWPPPVITCKSTPGDQRQPPSSPITFILIRCSIMEEQKKFRAAHSIQYIE